MDDDNDDDFTINWGVVLIFVVLIVSWTVYDIVSTVTYNAALGECSKAGGNIHVTWNGRHYCNHSPTPTR